MAHDSETAVQEKRSVALSSLLAAVLLTGTKLGIGWWTNSLGILAEAAHSALDLVAAGITFWAVKVSAQPADREHTYGHGKFENLSALAETLLLLATCVWIIYEAGRRLFFAVEEVEIDPSLWAFLVVILSIVVDYSRSRALKRAADKFGSQALEADALHFSTDIWSSAVVLLGLGGVLAAEHGGPSWLAKADAVAALGVALIVVGVSVQLGRRAVNDLLDTVPRGLRDQVVAAALQTPGVARLMQVRLRRSGPGYFVDLTLGVGRAAAFEQAHDIADQAEAAVRRVLPEADVVVHLEPVVAEGEDLTTTILVVAARHGLGAHSIRFSDEQGRWAVDLHVEVDRTLSLQAAHQQVSRFEEELRTIVPEFERIVTHIEPAGAGAAAVTAEPADSARIWAVVAEFLLTSNAEAVPHDLQVQQVGGELAVSLHLTLPAATAITAAHDLSGQLESHLRRSVPQLGRVMIHVEPDGA